jgi:hypothetical protein
LSVCPATRGRILGLNPDKSLNSFAPAIHSHLYSFALRFLFLQTHAISYSLYSLLYNVKEKGGKPDRKPYPLSYGLRNPYRNLKPESSQDYAQKSQQNCMLMNTASEGHERARIYRNTCTMEISYNGVHHV